MIKVTAIYDKDIDTITFDWMRDLWKERSSVPNNLDIEIRGTLVNTEIDWLNRLVTWTYGCSGSGTIKVNGTDLEISKFFLAE